jgi:hypothetical protein
MESDTIFLLLKQYQERELQRDIEHYRRARAVRLAVLETWTTYSPPPHTA